MYGKTRKKGFIFNKIFLRLLQLFGIVVFVETPEGVETSTFLTILTCARILFPYIPLVALSFYVHLKYDYKSVLLKTTDIIWTTASGIHGFTIWADALLKRKEHEDLYMKMRSFDNKLSKLKKGIDYKGHIRYMKITSIIRMITAIFPTAGQILLHWGETYQNWIPTVFFVTVSIAHNLFSHMTTCYLKMVKDRFGLLNGLLSELFQGTTIDVIENTAIQNKYGSSLLLLNNICYLHHFMTKTVKRFNVAFGLSFVVLFTVGFVNLVMGLFYCSSSFQTGKVEWDKLAANLLIAIYYAVDIIYTCHLGQYAIEEAKKSGLLIHKIETSDYDMKDEIEMFSLQIANEKVEFNAAGFFPINYTLVFSIIGGVTTYLIILIQLAANKSINP